MALPFEVTILGVNSAIPVNGRHPSCQVVKYGDKHIMIDCGEGSQSQLSVYKIKRDKISNIFISHLHGDHCFGLPGFLTSSSLQRRKNPLTIHGPIGVKQFIETVLEISDSYITYDLHIEEFDTVERQSISLSNNLSVETFPLDHRIPTMGFLIRELSKSFNIISANIDKYKLTIPEIKAVKKGEDLLKEGQIIPNHVLTKETSKLRAYGYVSDSIYDPSIVEYLQGVTTLYHETTYLDDMKELAAERKHTTVGGAVEIARSSGADKLITGHYSSRYKDISVFLEHGKALWDGVELGEEGRVYSV